MTPLDGSSTVGGVKVKDNGGNDLGWLITYNDSVLTILSNKNYVYSLSDVFVVQNELLYTSDDCTGTAYVHGPSSGIYYGKRATYGYDGNYYKYKISYAVSQQGDQNR